MGVCYHFVVAGCSFVSSLKGGMLFVMCIPLFVFLVIPLRISMMVVHISVIKLIIFT